MATKQRKPKTGTKQAKVVEVNRSAKTGEFVSAASVKRHPATTVTEHYAAKKAKKASAGRSLSPTKSVRDTMDPPPRPKKKK